MIKNIQNQVSKIILVIAVICIVVIIILNERTADEGSEIDWGGQAEVLQEEQSSDQTRGFIMVDIKGAVRHPNVYELQEGSRVFEAINAAGGLTELADERLLNLAQLITDEMVIYVPTTDETEELATGGNVFTLPSEQDGKVAINHADAATLEQLPGIGPAKAEAIISYREENGPFKDENDLLNVSGIGAKSIEKLSDKIVFR